MIPASLAPSSVVSCRKAASEPRHPGPRAIAVVIAVMIFWCSIDNHLLHVRLSHLARLVHQGLVGQVQQVGHLPAMPPIMSSFSISISDFRGMRYCRKWIFNKSHLLAAFIKLQALRQSHWLSSCIIGAMTNERRLFQNNNINNGRTQTETPEE